MSSYDNLEVLNSLAQIRPFHGLFSIRWRAEQILKKRTPLQWKSAAPVVQEWISTFKEDRTREEMETFIRTRSRDLSVEGGWELGYLSRDPYDPYPPGEAEIRNLLENWPSFADEQPDFPSEEDIDDLDALHDILCSGLPFDEIDGFLNATEYEIYAVLAMMKVNQAAGALNVPEERNEHGHLIYRGLAKWSKEVLVEVANLLTEGMEIVCFAERELFHSQFQKMRREHDVRKVAQMEIEIRQDQERTRKAKLSEAGKLGARSKNAPVTALKDWALNRASSMRGSDVDMARQLSASLPEHLADISKNPERLIYETLRNRKRSI